MKFLRYLSATILFIPIATHAVGLSDYGFDCSKFLFCNNANPISTFSLKIVSAIAAFILPLAILIFLYGAILMITSQGEEGKETGKKAMIYASLGLVAALLAESIVQFIQTVLYSTT